MVNKSLLAVCGCVCWNSARGEYFGCVYIGLEARTEDVGRLDFVWFLNYEDSASKLGILKAFLRHTSRHLP